MSQTGPAYIQATIQCTCYHQPPGALRLAESRIRDDDVQEIVPEVWRTGTPGAYL